MTPPCLLKNKHFSKGIYIFYRKFNCVTLLQKNTLFCLLYEKTMSMNFYGEIRLREDCQRANEEDPLHAFYRRKHFPSSSLKGEFFHAYIEENLFCVFCRRRISKSLFRKLAFQKRKSFSVFLKKNISHFFYKTYHFNVFHWRKHFQGHLKRRTLQRCYSRRHFSGLSYEMIFSSLHKRGDTLKALYI